MLVKSSSNLSDVLEDFLSISLVICLINIHKIYYFNNCNCILRSNYVVNNCILIYINIP